MDRKTLCFGLLSFMIFILVWHTASFFFKSYVLLFPTPVGVLKALTAAFPQLILHMKATFIEMLFGFFLATFFAFPVAICMARYHFLETLLQPFFIMLQCIPMFTLAPIFILFFGFSIFCVVVPMALMMSFPLTISIYRGLSCAPQEVDLYFSIHGASFTKRLFSIKIPSAKSHIFSGLRIASALSGIGAVGGEWVGAQKGLGVYMQIARRNFDLEGVCAAVFCLLLLSLCFYILIAFIEKLCSRKGCEKAVSSL